MKEQKEETKSTVGAVIGTVVLVAASVTGGWIACELWPKGDNGPAQMVQGDVTVAVEKAQAREYNLPERYVAHAEPVQEVDLMPQIDGYIKELHFKEGDVVKAGDVL